MGYCNERNCNHNIDSLCELHKSKGCVEDSPKSSSADEYVRLLEQILLEGRSGGWLQDSPLDKMIEKMKKELSRHI